MRGLTPPQVQAVEEAGMIDTVHVSEWGETDRAGMDNLSPLPQGQHRHPGDQPDGDTVEGGRGNN